MYSHRDHLGREIALPAGKVVCVGRNYAAHIEELNNEHPQQPVLFIKPGTALRDVHQSIQIPTHLGPCHNELEVAVLIKNTLSNAKVDQVWQSVWGFGLGLDLTLRDVQSQLKSKGLPWERAKGFDASCPVSGFVPQAQLTQNVSFTLAVNGDVRQQGDTKMMLWSIEDLLVEISQHFTLLPGDIVMTGTPQGVGPLNPGDALELRMEEHLHIQTRVVSA